MGDTWDVGSRPVSALLRGQLQLDEVVSSSSGLDSAFAHGTARQQQPPEQATWQLHWDRVQGPTVAALTQSLRKGSNPHAVDQCSAAASEAVVAGAATPASDAATLKGSSTAQAPGNAPGACAAQQCDNAACSASGSAQEGGANAAQQQGLVPADQAAAGGTAGASLEPRSVQQVAGASGAVTAAGEDHAAEGQEQQEQPAQDGEDNLQHGEEPYTPPEPSGPGDQGASAPSQQQQEQQQQQEGEEEEEQDDQQQPQQPASHNAEPADVQEQACSSALLALRDSYARAAAGAAWPLDYALLREHLQEVGTQPSKVAQLLQALHWRLCATPGGLQRFDLITDWVQKDILLLLLKPAQQATSGSSVSAAARGTVGADSLEQPSTSSSSMAGSSGEVFGPHSLPQQVMASGSAACQLRLLRLLRAASCSRGGRAYLLQPRGGVLRVLLQQLRDPQAVTRALQQHYRQQEGPAAAPTEQQDCIEVEMLVLVVSTLQKLALKRRAQTPLIRAGLVPWLVSLLAGDTLTKVDPECPAPVATSAAATAGAVGQSSSSAATSHAEPTSSSSSSAPQEPVSVVVTDDKPAADEADCTEQQQEDGEQEDGDEAADQSEEQPAEPKQYPAMAEGDDSSKLQAATSRAASAAGAVAAAFAATPPATAAAASVAPSTAAAVPLGLQPAHPQDLPAPLLHSATALLLQLVLRSAGAAAAAEPSIAARLLDVAAVLLGTSEAQVHAYTNATLYALFSNPSVCSLAVAKGLDQHLQQLQQQAPGASLQRQLQHVLARLQKRCAAAGSMGSPSLASPTAASSKRGQGGALGESDDEARQDDDEDEPSEDLADLEQQLAADVRRGLQEAGFSSTGTPPAAAAEDADAVGAEAAAAAAAGNQVLFGEQLLEASYPQLPDDPTSTCVSPTAMGRLSPTHPLMSSWGSCQHGSALGAGAGATYSSGWPGVGGVYGGWSLPPAQWGTGTHVLQMSGSWGTGVLDASIQGSGVGLGAGIAGQLQRRVCAAAQQTQHTLQHLQQSMTFTAPKAAPAPAGFSLVGLGAAGGGHQSVSATSPVPGSRPQPLSRTVHW